jgi:hypothetical protein
VLPRPLQMGDNMVEILKFSRETAFTPETIEILAAALDEVWERMRQSGSRLTRPAYSRVAGRNTNLLVLITRASLSNAQ